MKSVSVVRREDNKAIYKAVTAAIGLSLTKIKIE